MAWWLLLLPPLLLVVLNYAAPVTMGHLLVRLGRRLAGLHDEIVQLPDGLTMVYSTGGKGEPLVLLHGLGADRSSFETVAGLLRGDNRIVIPDLPGFGVSGRPTDGDYGVDAQVERVDRFVSALGLESFHLGGNSLGGWIATAYAARFPHKVKSLWLLAAAGTEEMLETEAVKARQERGEYQLQARDLAEFEAVLGRILAKRPFMPYCLRRAGALRAAHYFPLHSRIFDDLLERGEQFRLEPRLSDVKAPVLLSWGELDHIVPLSMMRTFQRLLPKSTVSVMPGIGHVPQMEAPRWAAREYRRFRAGVH